MTAVAVDALAVYREQVKQIVDAAPPLTDVQRAQLARIFTRARHRRPLP